MTTAIPSHLEAILGRRVYEIDLESAVGRLAERRILVTGAAGSVGGAVVDALEQAGLSPMATDKADLDVTDAWVVGQALARWSPNLVLHLAGAKHAPWAEENPGETAQINIGGTANIVSAAAQVGARVITASTCKACNPETVYGATKLVAERLTLEAGGSVARFFNVVETCGNVFRLWEELPPEDPLPVTPCGRYFLALSEAVALMIYAAAEEPGRYAVHPGRRPRVMTKVAGAAWPGRPINIIPARRGDRISEPLCAADEHMEPVNEWLWRVIGRHDGVQR